MDILNNTNTVIGIIGGTMGIIASLYGFITYLRNKASSAQKKQTIQLQATHSHSSYQPAVKTLSTLDWMQVLWLGLEDCFSAKNGVGASSILGTGLFVNVFLGGISSVTPGALIVLLIFDIIYCLLILCFYVYFVGRRVEKRINEINNA